MTERVLVCLAETCYAISGALTVYRLKRRQASPTTHPLNYGTMLAGFVCHTLFMYYRGQTLQRCPVTNSFEATVFITWAAVLFYLMIGPAYRVSFLGAFTAPFAFVLGLIALAGLDDRKAAVPVTRSPWVEFHASIAILACGAFALAFVTGMMYLIQERQLKSRKLTGSFLLLPSIEQLDVINHRLTLMGFGMLTAGMIGGMISYRIVGHWTPPKLAWAVATWLLYAGLVAGRKFGSWRGKKAMQGSMLLFVLVLVSYWGVSLYRGAP
jgi:HemX protein